MRSAPLRGGKALSIALLLVASALAGCTLPPSVSPAAPSQQSPGPTAPAPARAATAAATGIATVPAPTTAPSPTPGPLPAPTMAMTHSVTAPATAQAQAPAVQGPVLYQADFTDRKSGWPDELVFQNYYVGYHEPDAYHVEVQAPGDSAVVALPDRTFDDFAVETQVLVSNANTAPDGDFRYGLVLRRTGNRYYAFAVSPQAQTWYVLKRGPAGLQVLGQGQTAIKGLEAPDTLSINALGPVLTFSVDGQPVSQVSDPDYGAGEIGLYVETLDSTKAHIHYRTLVVRGPDTAPPAPSISSALYQADFTDRKSGWPDELVFQNYYVGYHEPDAYHVEVHAPGDSAVVALPGRTFDDFAAETQVLVSKANTAPDGDFRYGLVLRRTGNRYYAFVVSPRAQTWYVLKNGPAGLQVLGQGKSAIKGLEAPDTLGINALGPVLTFSVNGQPVGQLNDKDYTKGEIGLYVETLDSTKTHIHYRTLVVRPPDAAAPAAPPLSSGSSDQQGGSCRVVAGQLNLRRGPGTSYPPIVLLYGGTVLDLLGRNPDGSWLEVRVQGSDLVGWVSAGRYVACSNP